MKPLLTSAMALLVVLISNTSVKSQFVSIQETSTAQINMNSRTVNAASAYAKAIKLDHSFVNYCLTENNKKREHASDGSIPFGVNWRTIASKEDLNTIISTLEPWIRNDMILCLARAKADLAAAVNAAGAAQ